MTTHVIYTNVQIYFLKTEFELLKQMINFCNPLENDYAFSVLTLQEAKDTNPNYNRMTYPVLYNQNSH